MGTDMRRRSERLEVVATILLAFATVATAWSGYQASRWNGEQALAFSRASALRIESSKADARRNLAQKGIRINGKPVEGDNPTVSAADFLDGEVLVLQRGKRNNFLVLISAVPC